MKHKETTAALGLMLAALVSVQTAEAALPTTKLNAAVSANTSLSDSAKEDDVKASTNASVSLTGNMRGSSTDEKQGRESEPSEDSEGSSGRDRVAGSLDSDDARESGDAKASGSVTSSLSVNGASVRSSSKGSGVADASITAPAQVESDDNFKAYAEMTAKSDAYVRSVDADDTQVSVVFDRPARLFGFIPVNLKEKARVYVDASGKARVSVTKSWWAFLASDNVDTDRDASDIQSRMTVSQNLDLSAGLSAQARAQMLSSIETSSSASYPAAPQK